VLSSASTLRRFFECGKQPECAKRLARSGASGVVSQVNSLTSAIAQLNTQIQSTSLTPMRNPRRPAAADLSQLSQLIGINQVTTENNGLSITTLGQLLVSEGQNFQLTTAP